MDVANKRCSHAFCTKGPSFNVAGKKAAYCSLHAKTDMVNVRTKRCSHNSCLQRAKWGFLTDGTATTCGRHMGDLSGSPVVNVMAACKVVGCKKRSRWGVDGKQPTHCLDHGPLQEGLVRTVGRDSAPGANSRSPSYHPVRGPSFLVKAEALF